MSNYTKTTNFTAKDTLASGDPNKLVKGAEHDTEYDAIETAVNSKLDAYSGATDLSSAADADVFSIYDTDAGAYKKITVANARPALHPANDCSFRAVLTADQSINNVTDTKIQFNDDSTNGFDVGGDYDASTNYVFTAPADGEYVFHAVGTVQAISASDVAILTINSSENNSGDAIAASKMQTPGTTTVLMSCSTMVSLSQNATIWVEVYHNYGSARDFKFDFAYGQSSFSGWRIS